MSVAADNFVQQVTAAIPSSLSSIPGASNVTKAISGLASRFPPARRWSPQVWVSNNKINEVDLDLTSSPTRSRSRCRCRSVIGSGAPVTAPQGATALDLSKVPQLFAGILGGAGSSSSGSSATTAG